MNLRADWHPDFKSPGVRDLFQLHHVETLRAIEADRLRGEVRACHAVILSMLAERGSNTIRLTLTDLRRGFTELDASPMGDLIETEHDPAGVTVRLKQ